jgi:acyl-CoA reductase-like NAD-dependent aldehyde dehydrogenase
VYDEVVGRTLAAMRELRLGAPMDESTQVGAIISREQYERVVRYVEMARGTAGTRILCGGARPADPALQRGHFFEPTLIEGVPQHSPVCQDEIFGPVAIVSRWTDYERMLEDANDTQFAGPITSGCSRTPTTRSSASPPRSGRATSRPRSTSCSACRPDSSR